MIKQVGSSLKQNAKQTAKQVAKQLAQEPIEILKTAGKQVGASPDTGNERPSGQTPKSVANNQPTPQQSENPSDQKTAAQSKRLMEAYENELADIRQKEKQKELEKEQLEYYAEQQQEQQNEAKKENVIQVISKKGRRMFGKLGVKREQTRVENRQPPSG